MRHYIQRHLPGYPIYRCWLAARCSLLAANCSYGCLSLIKIMNVADIHAIHQQKRPLKPWSHLKVMNVVDRSGG